MKPKAMPPQDTLFELFYYIPGTGEFLNRKRKAGTVAGCIHKDGRRVITIQGQLYYASRLAWVYHYGSIPDGYQIDHIDGNKGNDAITNLRLATASQNLANRLPYKGLKGTTRLRSGKWQAKAVLSGRSCYLGVFDTQEEAASAYKVAVVEHYGQFARTR